MSYLPALLEKSSKSDAVAVRCFKALPPLASHFPRLAKRARRALEEYAIRHDYLTTYDNFENFPEKCPVDDITDSRDVTDITGGQSNEDGASDVACEDVPANNDARVFPMSIKHLHLRLVAMFGGLDEIYILGHTPTLRLQHK